MKYCRLYRSPLGIIVLESDGEALTGLWFDGQRYAGTALHETVADAALPVFEETAAWLDVYFGGRAPDITPSLRLDGTPFQQGVWKILRAIPYGQTVSYGEIALRIARQTGREKMSAQAVGGAVGRNPVSLIVPCHRVIGADGRLTGYAGGVDRKAWLLRLEGARFVSE